MKEKRKIFTIQLVSKLKVTNLASRAAPVPLVSASPILRTTKTPKKTAHLQTPFFLDVRDFDLFPVDDEDFNLRVGKGSSSFWRGREERWKKGRRKRSIFFFWKGWIGSV